MKKRGIISLTSMLICGTFVAGTLTGCQNEEEQLNYKLSLDVSDVKTEYFIGEEFTSYGLIVSLDKGDGSLEELSPSEYSLSIEDGTVFEEPSEEKEVVVTYVADPTVTAKYYIEIVKTYSLAEVFENYAQATNYALDITMTDMDDGSEEHIDIIFTDNATYYSTVGGGYSIDKSGKVFGYYLRDDDSIRPGEYEDSFDCLYGYVGEGTSPATWTIADIDYASICEETPNDEGYYEINDANNVQIVWQMLGYQLFTAMTYRADVKTNEDGTLTFTAEMKPQASYQDMYSHLMATCVVSKIGTASIPSIDKYVEDGGSAYNNMSADSKVVEAISKLNASRNYTVTVKDENLALGFDPIDKVIKFTEKGYSETNNVDSSINLNLFNYENRVYKFDLNDGEIKNVSEYTGYTDFWTMYSGLSKTFPDELKTNKISNNQFEILDKNNINALGLPVNPFLFSSIYHDLDFDRLVLTLKDDGTISYVIDYGNEGKVIVGVSDVGTTSIDGLDEYLETFTGLTSKE